MLQQPTKLVKDEVKHLVTFTSHPRPWHMPLMAGIAISFPVFVGAYFDQLALGLLTSLGAMVVLNLPYEGGFLFRMTQILACSFAFVGCFAVGLIAHAVPILSLPLIFFVIFWVGVFTRYYRLLPPAGVFIIMATAIALFMPIPLGQVPYYVGFIALGCLSSGIIACSYTLLLMLKNQRLTKPEVGYIPEMLVDSLLVAATSTFSLAVALQLGMPRPYWVLVGCYVVVVGLTFRSMWNRQLQRVVGTSIGMVVAWLILWLNPNAWLVAITVLVLAFLIETLVVRNYALGAIFITPLTIIMAEYGNPLMPVEMTSQVNHAIILARFWDTVLGCIIGVLGGLLMHSSRFRPKMQALEAWLFHKWEQGK